MSANWFFNNCAHLSIFEIYDSRKSLDSRSYQDLTCDKGIFMCIVEANL